VVFDEASAIPDLIWETTEDGQAAMTRDATVTLSDPFVMGVDVAGLGMIAP
jgi:hypothetical protein